MKIEELIKKNKLIAKFMGFTDHPLRNTWMCVPNGEQEKYSAYNLDITKLNYNSSWDLLMQVVDKIENHHFVEIVFCECKIYTNAGTIGPHNPIIIWEQGDDKIHAVWLAVLMFIEWTNANAEPARTTQTIN